MASSSLEGHTLGKYRVLEPLGRGGMARVYRAYHPQLDRYVAIKMLRSDLVEEEEFLARFRREAQAVAALRHPNIVQVYDFDVQDDVSYMVMELLEGDTLKMRLNDYRVRDEPMPWGEVVRILLDVLEGLAYAHSEDMVHRDIKPANILLTRRGQAVIADFGIAQIVGGTHHTAAGALMGTLNYMAPEQGLEGHSDARSDIYSLGIVFYEMLTRRTPFDADTPLAVLMKHLRDPLPLPRQINPAIPEPFERIVLKALAKEPDDRYQNAEEMTQALRQATGQAEIELPERISLPLSFTTPEDPSESVAVFSGTARERIADAQFAADDTDATLGQRLKAERAQQGRTRQEVGQELLSAIGGFGHLVVGSMAQALREAVDLTRSAPPEPPPTPPTPPVPPEFPPGTPRQAKRAARRAARAARKVPPGMTKAILGALGIVAAGNLAAVWVAGLTGKWTIFVFGWPVELFLTGLGLCVVMTTLRSIWMLIPVGLLLGNGVIFSYCSLTGNWRHWAFLWPLELLLIAGTILLTVRLARRKEYSRRLSRAMGWVLGLMALAWSLMVALMAVAVAVVTPA